MTYLKTLNELGIPVQLGDKYINVKDRSNIVEAINVCSLFHQGRRETCVIAKHILTKGPVVYALYDFLTSFAEYNEENEDVVINENYEIRAPETLHDNYNFN